MPQEITIMHTFAYDDTKDKARVMARGPTRKVSVSTDSEDLGEILDAFEDYLRGVGFRLGGRIDVVDEAQTGVHDEKFL